MSRKVDLRKLARGKPCMVRLPNVCNFNPETTVLSHYSLTGLSGKGLKSPNACGAWACSDCHDAVDRRTHLGYEYEYVRHCHAEAVLRTIAELVKLGVLPE